RPAVVVAAVAAGIGHDVDRGGAAQHLAAHRLDRAAIEIGLGLGLIAPVEHQAVVHAAHAERDRDKGVAIGRAGFQHQDARSTVLAEPIGEHAAGGACSDDDVVVAAHYARSLAGVVATVPLSKAFMQAAPAAPSLQILLWPGQARP